MIAATADTEARPTLSGHLLTHTIRQRDALIGHPLVARAFTGDGAVTAIRLWAQQRRLLCELKREALQKLIVHDPPEILMTLVIGLLRESVQELALYDGILAELKRDSVPGPGADGPAVPWLVTDGYGSNLFRHAVDGPRQALTAFTFAAATDLDLLTAMRASEPGKRWQPLLGTWPGPEFGHEVIRELRDRLDLRAPPGALLEDTVRELAPIAELAIAYEKELLDKCWFSGRWPAPRTSPGGGNLRAAPVAGKDPS